jgi:hypothetical protein
LQVELGYAVYVVIVSKWAKRGLEKFLIDLVWYNGGGGEEMESKCEKQYYDRWHLEWICSVYDMPCRVCCPCGREKKKLTRD